MKIYLATKWYSDWDGSSTHMIRAYKSRSEGMKYVRKGNRIYKKLQRFYNAKNKEFDKIMEKALMASVENYAVNLSHLAYKHSRFEGWRFELVEIDLVA